MAEFAIEAFPVVDLVVGDFAMNFEASCMDGAEDTVIGDTMG